MNLNFGVWVSFCMYVCERVCSHYHDAHLMHSSAYIHLSEINEIDHNFLSVVKVYSSAELSYSVSHKVEIF